MSIDRKVNDGRVAIKNADFNQIITHDNLNNVVADNKS